MTENITISNTPIYVAKPEGDVKGAIIVIHEVWGLTSHIKDVADRFASQGFLAYAPDLMSNTGIEVSLTTQLQQDLFNPEKRNEVQPKLRELMAPIQAPEFAIDTVKTLKQIFEQLYKLPEVKKKVAVVGYCFGGTYSYNLAIVEPRLVAAVPYYGHADQTVDELRSIQAPIMAYFGENDEALVSKLPDLENRMHQADVNFNYQVYSGCGHAFFNDTNKYAYNESAAKDSWTRTLDFLNNQFSL